MPLHYHSDFHPELGYHCALAVLFSKQPPQLNCPPDSVPSVDPDRMGKEIHVSKRGITLVALRLPPMLHSQNINFSVKVQ
jgi:hypothetical protein